MTRLLVSTVRRNSPPTVASGYIYVLDPDNQQVIQRSTIIEPAFKQNENNPRGGMRGAKGISIRSDEIALANSSMIFRYSPEWEYLGTITHPSSAFIHDIQYHGDNLWVAAACADMLLKFSLSGQLLGLYNLREPSKALELLDWKPPQLINEQGIRDGQIDFRDPASHDHILFDNAHVNSLGFLRNGEILVSMGFIIGLEFAALKQVKMFLMRHNIWPLIITINKALRKLLGRKSKNLDNTLVAKPVKARSAVVRITDEGERSLSLALNDVTTPSHSLLVLSDDTVIYLNTSDSAVVHFDPTTGVILSTTYVKEGFLRGVCSLDATKLAVGSKNHVLIYNWQAQKVCSTLRFTDDPSEAVYDIKVLPDHYRLPPISFWDHLTQTIGVSSSEDLISRQVSD